MIKPELSQLTKESVAAQYHTEQDEEAAEPGDSMPLPQKQGPGVGTKTRVTAVRVTPMLRRNNRFELEPKQVPNKLSHNQQ